MSHSAIPSPAVIPLSGATSPLAATTWELALDLFYECWRVSATWPPAPARAFRHRALTLSRLVGVAALTRCSVVVEVHLSSARQALADLEADLGRLLGSGTVPRPQLEEWIGWSIRLGVELSRWRLEIISRSANVDVAQNNP